MGSFYCNIICNHSRFVGFDHSTIIANPNIDPAMLAPKNAGEQFYDARLVEVHTP
jgi:hypothetical protein